MSRLLPGADPSVSPTTRSSAAWRPPQSSGSRRAGRRSARRRSRSNDRAGQAHYLDVTVFGESTKTLGRYGAKGRGLVVHGRIATHTWETQEGARRKTVDLVADEFHFADRVPASNGER